ncbi:MAG: tetratricopeptide repeat protein, partial [Chloroflexota bacterium]|nr:tetratricopeptide repeat protein [Chloroflexota bacterium]
LKQGNLPEAEQFIQQSLKLAQDNQDKILEGYAWRALGEVALALGNRDQAKENLDQAVALFGTINLPAEIEKTSRISQANGLSFAP